MFSYLGKLIRNFLYTEDDYQLDVGDAPEEFSNNFKNIDESSLSNISCTPDDKSLKCKRRKGKITYLSDDYGLIDDAIYFDASVIDKTLIVEVGDEVSFVVYKAHSNETERVIKIDEKAEGSWDDCNSNSNEPTAEEGGQDDDRKSTPPAVSHMERILNGKVAQKDGHNIYIEPLKITCNLNCLTTDFDPVEGDWVSLKVEVSVDENAINLAGDLLDVKEIKPLLSKDGIGSITLCSTKNNFVEFVIENQIYFKREKRLMEFKPQLGDVVHYDAIESEQGLYRWRAIWIKNINSNQKHVFEQGKNGIKISGKTSFGNLELGEKKELTLEVRNLDSANQTFRFGKFKSNRKNSQLSLINPKIDKPIIIEPYETVNFTFACKAAFAGASTEVFTFHFKNFEISRNFDINVSVRSEIPSLIKDCPRSKSSSSENTFSWKHFDVSNAIVGSRPYYQSKFFKRPSFNYKVPIQLLKIVVGEMGERRSRKTVMNLIENYAPYMKNEMNPSNYAKKFHLMLYLEEIGEKIHFKKYDLKNVIMKKKEQQLLALDVSSVMDGNITLLMNCRIIVTQPWSEVNTEKQIGYIHRIRDQELYIKFHEFFYESYDESACDVVFEPSVTTLIRAHAAVDSAVSNLGMNFLFPESDKVVHPRILLSSKDRSLSENSPNLKTSKQELKWFNEKLNKMQRLSVINAVEGLCRPLPYIIYGPPGTGKTVTIIEVIQQIYHLESGSRILVASPSNSSADLICEYLIDSGNFTPGELIRIVSNTYVARGSIPEKIVPYCSLAVFHYDFTPSGMPNDQNIRTTGAMDAVGSQRIIVGTLGGLGVLQNLNLKLGHFSHVVVDEAGQATEPDILIPLSFLDPKSGHSVLCGDPEQLGPICMSFYNETFGLSTSLLVRFTRRFPYQRNLEKFPETKGFDPRFIARLNVNYRSVPEILNLSSQLFYNSDLIALVSQINGTEADMIRKFKFESPNRDTYPAIIFHGVRSFSGREENGTSWCNPFEVWQVTRYLQKLYSIGLSPDDVGIITPYQLQVDKIRHLLNLLGLPEPKTGSVEAFQGQERYAIIVSTVRGTISKVDLGEDAILGFVASARRLNVAITRARALLIIVGNPFALSLNPYWEQVIRYCIENESFTGCSFDLLFKNDEEESDLS